MNEIFSDFGQILDEPRLEDTQLRPETHRPAESVVLTCLPKKNHQKS